MKIKNLHIILLIAAILILLRFEILIDSFLLLFSFFGLLFNDFNSAAAQINLPLIDQFISIILLFLVPLFLFIKRKEYNFLNYQVGFTSVSVILLLTFFIFSPLATSTHPDFQKNIGVTKLLPPFSSVRMITLKAVEKNPDNNFENFISLKRKVIRQSFDERIIFADKISDGEIIKYYQKNREFEINKSDVELIKEKIFLLGTDEFGRDIFSRLVYGTRVSLFVGLGAVIITFILGLLLGFAAGYPGGIIDSVLSRFTDMLLAFPVIFLIILILALFGSSLLTVIIVLGFSGWMSLFKIVRGEILLIKNKDYFVSARFAGLSKTGLLFKEILPVIIAPVIVNLVFQYGNVILAEAALSFLGLGTGGIYPSWGEMIEAGQSYLTKAWWMIFFPGLFLFVTLFTANNFGRKVSAYYNPRMKND